MTAIILGALVLTSLLLMWPRVSQSQLWRATTTPLASIIGSGFLVLGPILHASFGYLAPVAMAALCFVAYLFGGAIRFNIAAIAAPQKRPAMVTTLETVASWALSFAYVISVAYYLNLFGAFAVALTPWDTPINARLVTTVVMGIILMIGLAKGFSALERVEQISVGIKLSIIAALLAGLAVYFVEISTTSGLIYAPISITGWPAVVLGFGLLITVQGFETSRYLGETYDANQRIKSMKLAQIVSTVIYLVYIALLSYVFIPSGTAVSETEIIAMMQVVAPILPMLLVAAALAAQFSAAIADTSGSSGLVVELTRGKVTEKSGYALLIAIALLLTWGADIFQIISFASRAFAFYYALQAAIAALTCNTMGKRSLYWSLAILGAFITVFARAIEGA